MDIKKKLPISVIIPVKNEATNIERCLASVAWAGEVIVVDSASTDATAAIATSYGARVIQFTYTPPWPKKKQWALDHLPLSYDWVLLLDADEVMPADSTRVISQAIANASPTAPVGYYIDRRFFFWGAPLRYAYTPNWNLRLIRRGQAHFECLTTAETHSGDNEVHEHLIAYGPTAQLPLVMDHYAFPTTEVFLEKHTRYAAWEAAVELHPTPPTTTSGLSPFAALRRALKRFSRHLPFRPTLRWLWVLFGQRAILDGTRGRAFARLHAIYEELILVKKAELKAKENK